MKYIDVKPKFPAPFCCCSYIGKIKLLFCGSLSLFSFVFLMIISEFMYRKSPYLDLSRDLEDDDYDKIGLHTRIASFLYNYVYFLIRYLFIFIVCVIQSFVEGKYVIHSHKS